MSDVPGVSAPPPLSAEFVQLLKAQKSDFVETGEAASVVAQHGAASVDADFPGWPDLAGSEVDHAVIEMFVIAGDGSVTSMSVNEPYVSAWQPLAEWLAESVQAALAEHGAAFDGDAYLTASITTSSELEGLAHLDDDLYVPDDNVSVVAIVGQHAGPRVAIGSAACSPMRPMGQAVFPDETLAAFMANELECHHGTADQIVLFPQFAQIHAGPAAQHVLDAGRTRQLLVLRARVAS